MTTGRWSPHHLVTPRPDAFFFSYRLYLLAAPVRLEVDKIEQPVGDRAIGLVIAPPDRIPRQRAIAEQAATRGAWRSDLDAAQAHRKTRRLDHTMLEIDRMNMSYRIVIVLLILSIL